MSQLNPDPTAFKLTDAELTLLNGAREDGMSESEANIEALAAEDAASGLADGLDDQDDYTLADSGNDTETQDDGEHNEGQELQAGHEQDEQDGEQGERQAAEVAQAKSWINQKVLDYAASRGLNEADVRSFGSMDELERVATLLDRHVSRLMVSDSDHQDDQSQNSLQSGQQQAASQTHSAQAIAAQGQAVQAAAAPTIPDGPGFKDGKLDLKYFEENYEPNDPIHAIVKLAAAQSQQIEGMASEHQKVQQDTEALFAHLQRQEQISQYNAFHMAVDGCDNSFFGKAFKNGQPQKLSDEDLGRRDKVLQTAVGLWPKIQRQYEIGIIDRMPSYQEVVQRAARVEFGPELDQLESTRRAERLRAQARKKRPVSNSSPSHRPRPVSDKAPTDIRTMMLNNPDLIAKYEQLEKQGASS